MFHLKAVTYLEAHGYTGAARFALGGNDLVVQTEEEYRELLGDAAEGASARTRQIGTLEAQNRILARQVALKRKSLAVQRLEAERATLAAECTKQQNITAAGLQQAAKLLEALNVTVLELARRLP